MRNLKQTVLLLHTELKCAGSRKHWNVVSGIVLIVIMISTISYVLSKESEPEKSTKETYLALGIANEDTSEYARLLISYFKDNPDFTEYVSVTEGEKTSLKRQFEEGILDCLLVIPEGFAEQMIQMEHLPIEVLVSAENPTKALLLQTALSGYESYIKAVEVNCAALYDRMREDGFSYEERQKTNIDISMELIFTALGKDAFFTKREMERGQRGSVLTGYLYAAFWFLMLFLYFPAGNQLRGYFEKGLAQRMFVAQVPKSSLLVAVLFPYVLLTCVAAVFPVFFAGGERAGRWGIAVSLLFPMLFLVTLLGIVCKNAGSYLFAYSMMMLGLALAGGSIIPALYLPDEFLLLTKWLPNYQFTRMLQENITAAEAGKVCSVAFLTLLALSFLLLLRMKQRGEEKQNV